MYSRVDFIMDNTRGRVLNVGATAEGAKIHELLAQSGSVTSLEGCDIVQSQHPSVFVHDIQDRLPITEHKYDTIVCGEVLEHLSNPTRALCNMLDRCESLVLTTPNIKALSHAVLAEGREHLYYVTPSSTGHLARHCGALIIESQVLPYEFTAKRFGVLKQLLTTDAVICQVWARPKGP